MASFKAMIVITGGQQGLGFEAARIIAAARPDTLVIISSRSSGVQAAQAINNSTGLKNVIWEQLDLASQPSIRSFATKIATEHPNTPITALLLNAGIQQLSFTTTPASSSSTDKEIETTFAVNHLGHALLFYLLSPSFSRHGTRIVLTSSGVHDPAQKTGIPEPHFPSASHVSNPPATSPLHADGRKRYSTSKLANVLWTYALARHLGPNATTHITVTALDPGLMPGTGLAREGNAVLRFIWHYVLPNVLPLIRMLLFKNTHTPQESGEALARLAIADDVQGVTGKYFEGLKEIPSSAESYDEKKQDDLWNWTADLLARDEAEKKNYETLLSLA